MTQLVIASNNPGKIKEIKTLLAPFQVDVVSLKDLGLAIDVPETGTTFQENAQLKAEAIAARTGQWTLADDSGLCVDALGGEPGVYSARYSGPEKDDTRNIDKLLGKMAELPDEKRNAFFTCVLALSHPGKPTHFAEGRCDGRITRERHGESGFGYDPVFLIVDRGETFAEMGSEAKNAISHRARALRQLAAHWKVWTGEDE